MIKARESLKNNETAIIIFTDGRGLEIDDSGSGTSGVWVIGKNAFADKVIIYKRDKGKKTNKIYRGNFVQLLPSNEKDYENRFVVEFDSMEYLGETNSNWNEFTETKRGAVSPIKYIR
jgi:hypothetical protein